jgi:imidazolonepropionase-like amidohydrolase
MLPLAAGRGQVGEQDDSTRQVAIRAARLIDGRGGAPLQNPVVIVKGERIFAVGSNLPVPQGAQIIDLSGATLLPGLIDCHTHITSQPQDYYADKFRRTPIDNAVTAHVYARRTLEAGFTTVRDVGAGEFIDVALRNAIHRHGCRP